jgi:hypothetical protein
LSQALDQLVQALDTGIKLDVIVLDQSDKRKAAYWREILCPALQAAKEAKAKSITFKELVVIGAIVEQYLEHAMMVKRIKQHLDLPEEFTQEYFKYLDEAIPLLKKLHTVTDNAAVETVLA